MTELPLLCDRTALSRQRTRAAAAPARFLQELVADEIQDRLIEVNRAFTDQAVVTAIPSLWAERLPGAEITGDDDILSFEAGSKDLVIHALALHWANDPVGQLVQSRLALRPDGFFLCALFGGQTLHELRRCLAEAEAEVSGGLAPRVAPMGEIRDLGMLLQRAGFALPVADSATLTVTYENAFALMKDLRAMGEGNAMEARLRRPSRRAVFLRAAQIYAAEFGTDDGRIPATFEIVYLTGWAPDASQPQPLRPGSAAMRLADALGTPELKLPKGGD